MRKKLLAGLAVGLLAVGVSSTAISAPINLSTWTGTAGGSWNVQGSGTSVLQTTNGQPTMFLSDQDYFNTQFDGKFGVETTSDDDFIGFVFGYQNPNDYYLFDWKQGIQGNAQDGFTLSHVTGSASSTNFWDHNGNVNLLATDYGASGNDRGWADNTVYDFRLVYTASLATIAINGSQIFSQSGSFSAGKFGFYNYSQSQVRYQGFEEVQAPPSGVPEPATMLLFGTGLLGLAGVSIRRKRK